MCIFQGLKAVGFPARASKVKHANTYRHVHCARLIYSLFYESELCNTNERLSPLMVDTI